MKIRAYEPRDADGVARVYRRSVEELGPRHYTPEQVAAWVSRAPDAAGFNARLGDGRTAIVAADANDEVVAFIDLEADGHIDLFYCAPEYAGKGIALLLYATIEAIARERGIARLDSEASEAAWRFFRTRRFAKLHRRDLTIGDVTIYNYAVEKTLD